MICSVNNSINKCFYKRNDFNKIHKKNGSKDFFVSFKGKSSDNENISANLRRLKPIVLDFHSVPYSIPNNVKLPLYIEPSVKENEVNNVNISREKIIKLWISELEKHKTSEKDSYLNNILKQNKNLSSFIISSITSPFKDYNRIMPSPYDEKTLSDTIKKCFCSSESFEHKTITPHSFLETYDNTLVQNTLNNILNDSMYDNYVLYSKDGEIIDKKKINNIDEIHPFWVKIPKSKKSFASDFDVSVVENLSNPNWCTRSRENKAQSVLEDGNFYIYLDKKSNNNWESKLAITSYNGKISQIQGKKNDNFIPLQMKEIVVNFLTNIDAISSSKNLAFPKNQRCETGYNSELPLAYTQLLITQKLTETTQNALSKKTVSLNTAIKNNDSFSIFKILYPNSNVKLLDNNKLSISSYKSSVNIDTKSLFVPITFFGIDENKLLSDVQKVTGVFNLSSSNLKAFPSSIKEVSGDLVLSKNQYEEFIDYINENYSYGAISKKHQFTGDVYIISSLKSKN